jgi:preprotein translocase subunit SecF
MNFFKKTHLKFVDAFKYAIIISSTLILITIVSLVIKGGLNYGIDFSGGALVQVKFANKIQVERLRSALAQNGITGAEIQEFSDTNEFIIRLKKNVSEIQLTGQQFKDVFVKEFAGNEFVVERNEYVGPSIGERLKGKAIKAIAGAFLGIVVYVAIRFRKGIWGFAGVLALMHDVFITIGLFSILNKEINLTIVAALLTLAGYSINDTIVVYDRIRDNMKLYFKKPLKEIFDMSINDTLSRTIMTSLCTELVLIAIYFLGGTVIHDFALTLLFGTIIGTYSSVFIASPIVYMQLTRKTATSAKK